MVEYTNKSGNISENIRTFALPFEDSVYNFRMMFEYDAWNREQRIVYPDGETVSYDYDRGGQLFKMSNYLDSVLYDKYGAVTSRKYGNGLKMQYAYHPQNRRLTVISTLSGNSQLSHTAYTYDLVGNVTQAVSSYPWLPGQTFTENFAYDSTNQLVSAANAQTYALSVTYGDWGKIQEYGLQQTDLASNTTTGQTRTYNYGSLNEGQTAFAPNNINYTDGTNVNEQYGINGSLQRRETNRPGNQPETEHYRFTANGNLQAYMYENLLYVHYGYNDANTRTYKYTFDLNPQWVNGRLEAVNFNPHTAMFYPNSYLNFNQDGHYTKHYYNGMERIASRLGDQNLQIHTHDPELQDRKDWQDSLIRKNVTEITGYEFLPVGEEQNHEDPKPVFELPVIGLNNLQPSADGIYYYHPNHLGSTCYVTDGNASVVQGFLYAPFGEITNEHNSSFGNGVIPKYSFNAKELDEETGMYYYEARYMAPPVFISRDPLFEKYPTISPYTYCANNPVNVTDPSGDTIIVNNRNNLYLFTLDDGSETKTTLSAKELYDKGIQWVEPQADNYMPLLCVNKNIENIDGIDHFSWQDIEEFAFTDRLMYSYKSGKSGDFKKNKTFLCTVDGIPYWTDIIGQIPFAINCYKDQLMNGASHSEAAERTKRIGHLFADGSLGKDKEPNNADNWMIKRVCDWASKGLVRGELKKCGFYHYYQVNRTSYEFNKLAIWIIK